MVHTHRYHFCFKKKKNQVKSPSPESRVPEIGSDPPIESDRDSGRDRMGHGKGMYIRDMDKWTLCGHYYFC